MKISKAEALKMLKALGKVPSSKDYKTRSLYWLKCSQLSKDLLSTNGAYEDLHKHLMTLLKNERSNLHRPIDFENLNPSDLEIGARVVANSKEEIEYWISITEDWVQENMKDVETKSSEKTKPILVSGLRYVADGENAYLETRGERFLLTDPKQQRGKNSKVHLLDLLSFPDRVGPVLKGEFDKRLESVGQRPTSSTFADTIRALNSQVQKKFADETFIVIGEGKCEISAAFKK
jgi:hypothetical protein